MEKGKNTAVQLVVEDGSRRYELRNTRGDVVGEFAISPTDIGIFERFAAMQQELEGIAEPFEALEDAGNMTAFVAATSAAREKLCAAIDSMFGREGTAARLFGSVHPFTPVDGRFYFDRVLEAVGAQIDAMFESEAEKFARRVGKYLGE